MSEHAVEDQFGKLDLTLGAHALLEVLCAGFGTNLLFVSSVTVASWSHRAAPWLSM